MKSSCGGFFGGSVIKNPPVNAGDTGSNPDLGGSHMPGVTKPLCHNKNYRNEKAMHCNQSSPCLVQREKSPCSKEDSAQPKIVN